MLLDAIDGQHNGLNPYLIFSLLGNWSLLAATRDGRVCRAPTKAVQYFAIGLFAPIPLLGLGETVFRPLSGHTAQASAVLDNCDGLIRQPFSTRGCVSV